MDIRAENISMTYDDAGKSVEVLKDISVSFEKGSRSAIIGESGSGKTTLLNILGTLEIPTSGEVYLGDDCLTERVRRGEDLASFRGSKIGIIFQFHHLLPEFTALENVLMPHMIHGEVSSDVSLRAEELLCRVGLKDRMTHRPSQLSGGEQQRVAIARAICPRPAVILADEPTGNLDVKTGAEVYEVLLEMQEAEKSTLIVVTHSQELARTMGRIVELTPTGLQEL